MERSFDNDVLDVTCAGVEESKGDDPMVDVISYEHDIARQLDAIYLPDDGDETKSFILVQCRTCKWTLPVEAFDESNCLCNWDHEAALEEEMARMSLLPPPPLDIYSYGT